MGSRSKTTAKGHAAEESSSNNSENAGEPCVVCAGKPSKNIIRDTNFEKMIHLFIEGLKIDVKPGEYKKLELCKECFELLVEFYDTNDVLVHLEKHMNEARFKIIAKTLEGIKQLKKNGTPLLPVHVKVISSWGEDPKSVFPGHGGEVNKETGTSVITHLEDAPTSSSPSKTSKRSSSSQEPESTEKADKSNGITISNNRKRNVENEKVTSLRDRKKRK